MSDALVQKRDWTAPEALDVVLEARTLGEAALRLGAAEAELVQQLAQPLYRGRLAARSRAVREHLAARVQRVAHLALEGLLAVVEDPGASPAVRVSACRAVLALALDVPLGEDALPPDEPDAEARARDFARHLTTDELRRLDKLAERVELRQKRVVNGGIK